jgi:radical SAM superfamily enzyme YgiQ (UPF0313 family)
MRVALVFPPYTYKGFSENLRVVDEEFCVAPPIILAYVAAILEKAGHTVMLLDARALKLTKEESLCRLQEFQPQVLGFRAESYYFYDALSWMRHFKEHMHIPVFAGGVNFSLYPQETMRHKEIDFGVRGNGLVNMAQLLDALEKGTAFSHIPDLLYREGDRVIATGQGKNDQTFDSYPMPARHLLPNDRYYSFVSQRKNFSIMLTSVGCPSECAFCAIPRSMPFSQRSPEKVVDEMEICYRDFGIREIDIFDANFFINKERCLKIFELMKQRGIALDWTCRSRVDIVDDELLRLAADAGCRQINYGIESSDTGIIQRIHKGTSNEQVERAIALTRKYGIRTMGFFMIGNEGETKASVRKSMAFAKKLRLDYVQVCRTIPKPGSALAEKVAAAFNNDPWKAHIAGEPMIGRLPVFGTALTEKEITDLTREFYIKFYFRPSIILRRIFGCQSFSEFIRYVRVALRMILN